MLRHDVDGITMDKKKLRPSTIISCYATVYNKALEVSK